MDRYIPDLLKTHDRLIIPELGAFMVMKDKDDHIVFNEFLKFNDGLLIKHVAESEGLDATQSLAKVEEWVQKVQVEIDKDGYTIKGLGKLAKDDQGKIQFSQDTGSSVDPPKKTVAKKKAPAVKKEAPPKKEKKAADPEPTLKTGSDTKSKTVKTLEETVVAKETVKESIKEPSQASPEKEDKKETEETPVKEEEKKPEPEKKKEVLFKSELDSNQENAEKNLRPKKEKGSSEESNKKGYWLWLFLVLLLIVIFIVWFFFLRTKPGDKYIPPPPEEEIVEEPQPVVEGTPVVEQAPEPEQVQPAVPKLDPAWYVVAGCFEFEKNADDYVQELRAKGFNALKFGIQGDLYMVSFESYDNRRAALLKLREIRFDHEPDAWMIHY